MLYIADMMGYSPIGQQAASVALTFTMRDPDPSSRALRHHPMGTRVYNRPDNADALIVFETQEV